jgi:hypothetical protein
MIIDSLLIARGLARLKTYAMGIDSQDDRNAWDLDSIKRDEQNAWRDEMIKLVGEARSERILASVAQGYTLEEAAKIEGIPIRFLHDGYCQQRSFVVKLRDALEHGRDKATRRKDPLGWYLHGELRRAREVRAPA